MVLGYANDYGVMLWYILAAHRPKNWLARPQGSKRAYRLL